MGGLQELWVLIRSIFIILVIGAAVAWIFYYYKMRDLFGGYIGGFVVGVMGALIGAFILDKFLYDITVKILSFLARDAGVNIIAGFVGGYIAVFIMNRLNHNKERKKY
ncbi:MAG: hypothetical protein C4529_00805 [Deltaproteobacteria bacterium]|nr:MAG: hypothetical protein C4529_00805 [Deltaproteobacteria bacterium]